MNAIQRLQMFVPNCVAIVSLISVRNATMAMLSVAMDALIVSLIGAGHVLVECASKYAATVYETTRKSAMTEIRFLGTVVPVVEWIRIIYA